MSAPLKAFPWLTTSSVIVAVLGNLMAAAILTYPLFQLPAGSGVRLLGESLHSAVASLATFVVVAILGIVALRRERHRAFTLVAFVLSLTPFFFAGWVMRYVADI